MRKKIKKKHIFLLFLFSLLCCDSESNKKYYENFDISLIKQSKDLKASGDINAFLKLQQKYLNQAEKIGYNEGKGICYVNLALVSFARADSQKNLFLLKQAERELKNSEKPEHLTILYNGFTTYYMNMNMYENAYYESNKAFNELKKIKNKELKNELSASAFLKRSMYFYYKSQYDSAFFYMNKCNTIEKNALNEGILASFYMDGRKFDSAYIHINRALDIIGNKKTAAQHQYSTYLTLGQYYFMLKQYPAAEQAYMKAMETASSVKKVYGANPELYGALAALYKAEGDKEKSNYYAEKFKAENKILEKNRSENINPAIDEFIGNIKNEGNNIVDNKTKIFGVLALLYLTVGCYGYWKIKRMYHRKYKLEKYAENLKKKLGNDKYNEVVMLAKNSDPLFLPKFRELHPGFIEKLLQMSPFLGKSELLLSAFIKLHFTTKEIASYTSIQPQSVQQKKRRLRKKLGISSEVDLYNFFDTLTADQE